MLQQEEPEDYVIATGVTTRVRDFIKMAFQEVGLLLKFEGEGINEIGILKAINADRYQEALGKDFSAKDF